MEKQLSKLQYAIDSFHHTLITAINFISPQPNHNEDIRDKRIRLCNHFDVMVSSFHFTSVADYFVAI